MADVIQKLDNCELIYNLTGHKLDVLGPDGNIKLRLWRIPDTPGGFDIAVPEHAIEVNNPSGVNFHPMHDTYEDNEALFG